MRVSIAVCEAPEQTEKVRRTFSHVSAGRTQSARSRGVSVDLDFKNDRRFMPSGQGTSGRGLRPEMVPPGAPRIAGGNKICKGEAFVSIDFEKGPTVYKQIEG